MKRFSEEHEWVSLESNGVAGIGITQYAADELGEITFIELPEVGTVLAQGDVLCVVESVKTAQDVICPIGGTVDAVNAKLDDDPGLINVSAEKEGWICRLREVDEDEIDALMTEEAYEEFTGSDEED